MTPPKGKQRSIHMDDETFELLQALALKHKANNSTIVRMALAAYAGPATAPVLPTNGKTGEERVEYGSGDVQRDLGLPSNNPRNIALPDAKISSFNVSGGRVRGKVPRNDREDDGLDV